MDTSSILCYASKNMAVKHNLLRLASFCINNLNFLAILPRNFSSQRTSHIYTNLERFITSQISFFKNIFVGL